MKRWFLSILGLLLVACAFAPGIARADVRTEARRAFRQGMELVQQGHIDEGVASLERAYEILPHPNVLYNIARAYAEAGRYDEALEYFDRYLSADPPDREEVEGFVQALQDRVAARAQATQTAEQAAAQEAATQATTAAPTEAVEPMATDEEIRALDDASTQIAALAEATMSDSLRARAARLHDLADQLRERRDAAAAATAAAATQGHAGGGHGQTTSATPPEGGLDIGAGEGDVYAEQVVSSSRFAQSPLDAPNSTTNITAQDIHLIGHTNVAEYIRRVAGADIMATSPADVQIGMRGFNQRLSPRVLVLVDGRSVYLDTLGTTFWTVQPFGPEDIERIEVIRGPASALYGADAFSGIINIITKDPGPQRTDAILGFGSASQVHGHVSTSGRVDRLGYRLVAGYDRANRFTREVSAERESVAGDYEQLFDRGSVARESVYANGRLQYRLNQNVNFDLQAGLNDNQQNFQGTGPLRDLVARGPNAFTMGAMRTNWGSLRVFWNGTKANSGAQAVPRGGDLGLGRFVSNTVDVEGELAHEFHLLVDHNLHIGIAYRYKTINWEFLDAPHQENHYGVYFQDTARIVEQLIAVASFRVDFHPLLPGPVFSPRGALVFRPSEGQAIRASVGTAFRTQTFLESYLDLDVATPVAAVTVLAQGSEVAALSNPDFQKLSPENILSAEVGYRNAENDYFDVEGSIYYNHVTNTVSLTQIQPYTLSDFQGSGVGYTNATAGFPLGSLSFQNESAQFDVVGGELSTRVYPITGLDIYANYAYNRAFVSNSTLRTSEERTSRHKVNAGIQYRSSIGLDFGVDVHFASHQVWLEQVFDAVEGVKFQEFRLPSYYMINARIGYRLFDDQLEFGLVGYNITDNRHREHPFGQELALRVLGTAAYHF